MTDEEILEGIKQLPAETRRHLEMVVQAEGVLQVMSKQGITVDPDVIQQMKTEQTIAAYKRYGNYVGWKNYAGLPMPRWEDLTEKIQGAWFVAINGK